jgi:HSP20 family protein
MAREETRNRQKDERPAAGERPAQHGSRVEKGEQPGMGEQRPQAVGRPGVGEAQHGLTTAGVSASQMLSPFSFMRRFSEEMDRLFEDFGFGGSLFSPARASRGGALLGRDFGRAAWAPQVEVFQRGDEMVVRADVPGVRREDLKVEFDSEGLTIEGERRYEETQKGEGTFHSERSYGHFFRRIPLPDGADADSAKASFRDGVLEVVVKVPQKQPKSRQIEIR